MVEFQMWGGVLGYLLWSVCYDLQKAEEALDFQIYPILFARR